MVKRQTKPLPIPPIQPIVTILPPPPPQPITVTVPHKPLPILPPIRETIPALPPIIKPVTVPPTVPIKRKPLPIPSSVVKKKTSALYAKKRRRISRGQCYDYACIV